MLGIVRLYNDSYGKNMGSRTFCQLSKYFGGVLITDNKKIRELTEFRSITHREALDNVKKFTKLLVYNTKPNMFGGIAPKNTPAVVRLIKAVPDVYFYNCDPILDLQLSVPSSHEKAVPGLTSAINKMIHFSKRLDRTNTDLTKFLAGKLKDKIVPLPGPKKQWIGCYFGNARQPERQKQVFQLLNPLKSRLIIGHEHEHFAWFDYTPDFYNTLSTAWVTPIIGDKKLHYETGIPSLRLYEACCSTAVVLIDGRFKREEGLDERFYFDTPEEFHKKAKMISENRDLYFEMVGKQQRFVISIIKQYGNKVFSWKKVKKAKEQKEKEVKKERRMKKDLQVAKAKKRLIERQVIKK